MSPTILSFSGVSTYSSASRLSSVIAILISFAVALMMISFLMACSSSTLVVRESCRADARVVCRNHRREIATPPANYRRGEEQERRGHFTHKRGENLHK